MVRRVKEKNQTQRIKTQRTNSRNQKQRTSSREKFLIKQFNCLIKLNQENLIKRNQIRCESNWNSFLREKLFQSASRRIRRSLLAEQCSLNISFRLWSRSPAMSTPQMNRRRWSSRLIKHIKIWFKTIKVANFCGHYLCCESQLVRILSANGVEIVMSAVEQCRLNRFDRVAADS